MDGAIQAIKAKSPIIFQVKIGEVPAVSKLHQLGISLNQQLDRYEEPQHHLQWNEVSCNRQSKLHSTQDSFDGL